MESKNHPPTERPSVAVDAIVFTVESGKLKVLLIVRDHEPFNGLYAIPGVFVLVNESLEDAVARVLQDKGGIASTSFMEQLYTFGKPDRDPRGRVIGISYLSLVNSQKLRIVDTPSKARWFDVESIPHLAFDHGEILKYALQRLRWKIEYSTAAFALLPDEFTVSNVQSVYEAILGRKFDRGNFWKRIIARGILKETGKVEEIPESARVHRPGKLYTLACKIGDIISILC